MKQSFSVRLFNVIFLVMIACISALSAADNYRTFTDTQNRIIEGVLKSYNADDQSVTIERTDGKSGQVPLAMLSEQDRNYICNWCYTNDFLNDVKLTVKLKSEAVTGEDAAAASRDKGISDFYYCIDLDNATTSPFARIDVRYCIFYRQGKAEGSTTRYKEGICSGQKKLKSLKPGTAQHLETSRVRLFSASGAATMFGDANQKSLADIRGIWLRLKTRLPSGDVIEREYRSDDDEMWKWVDCSIGVGMNKGSGSGGYMLN
jgi:hypothetical protein